MCLTGSLSGHDTICCHAKRRIGFSLADSLLLPISLNHTNVVAMTNAIRILLLTILQDLPLLGWITAGDQISDQLSAASITICRTMDYQLEQVSKGASSHLLFWPLKMAFEALGHTNPAVEAWLRDLMDQISSGLAGKWSMAAENIHKHRRNISS